MNIEYRKLKSNETQLYRNIRLESLKSYPNNFCSTYDEHVLKPKLPFETYIEQDHSDKFIVGAFHDNQLIGICGFFIQSDNRSKHRGEIIQMYVKPKYHGKKIGQALLQATLDEAFKLRSIEQIELGVLTNSEAAERIYEKAGFQEYGLQMNYLKDNSTYFDQRLMVIHRDNKIKTGYNKRANKSGVKIVN